MQGSTGSALLTNIVITIIGIIIVIFAASFAYAKAYRAKSIIIDIIEEYGGKPQSPTVQDIKEQLSNVGYNQSTQNCKNKHNRSKVYYKGKGYCLYQVTEEDNYGNISYYYEVETYMHFDIPLIGFTIPVYGQTISFRDTVVNIDDSLDDD